MWSVFASLRNCWVTKTNAVVNPSVLISEDVLYSWGCICLHQCLDRRKPRVYFGEWYLIGQIIWYCHWVTGFSCFIISLHAQKARASRLLKAFVFPYRKNRSLMQIPVRSILDSPNYTKTICKRATQTYSRRALTIIKADYLWLVFFICLRRVHKTAGWHRRLITRCAMWTWILQTFSYGRLEDFVDTGGGFGTDLVERYPQTVGHCLNVYNATFNQIACSIIRRETYKCVAWYSIVLQIIDIVV